VSCVFNLSLLSLPSQTPGSLHSISHPSLVLYSAF
jgi:hypothetical protein